MRRALSVCCVLAVAVAAGLPALAGEGEGQEVELTGWITDEWCGARNANADGADCARNCAKKGAALALYSDGELYQISDKDLALEHVGYKVKVKGTLGEENVLTVTSIKKAEDEA